MALAVYTYGNATTKRFIRYYVLSKRKIEIEIEKRISRKVSGRLFLFLEKSAGSS